MDCGNEDDDGADEPKVELVATRDAGVSPLRPAMAPAVRPQEESVEYQHDYLAAPKGVKSVATGLNGAGGAEGGAGRGLHPGGWPAGSGPAGGQAGNALAVVNNSVGDDVVLFGCWSMLRFAVLVFVYAVPSGDDKTPATSSQKRKRASKASPVTTPSTAAAATTSQKRKRASKASPVTTPSTTSAERVDNADTLNIKPIHFNIPPILEIPRFGDPNVAERINTPQWDGHSSLGSLEGRLLAQNEAVWNRVRILNEQVVQMVEMSNQRLLSQMQSLFTQIRLQIQVYNAQMQTKVHEATQSIQAELQAALKAHTEQLFNQLQSHGPSSAGSHPHPHPARGHQPPPTERPPQNGSWPSDSTPRPTPPDIQVDFSQLPVPPLQPVHMPREKERIVRQRTEEQCVVEGLPAPPRTSNRLLPHISDVQKAEILGANKTRLPPHISDVDRILRQQQSIPLPTPLPSWKQTSFVISELDRVLGQRPLNLHMIPPAPGPTYLGVKMEKPLIPASPSSSMGVNINPFQEPHPGHHFAREMDANPRHAWSEGPLNVLALPGVSGNPNQSMETSSGQDVEPSSRHPASSSGTVDGEETTQDSGQDTGAASSEKLGSRHTQRGGRTRQSHPNRPRL